MRWANLSVATVDPRHLSRWNLMRGGLQTPRDRKGYAFRTKPVEPVLPHIKVSCDCRQLLLPGLKKAQDESLPGVPTDHKLHKLVRFGPPAKRPGSPIVPLA